MNTETKILLFVEKTKIIACNIAHSINRMDFKHKVFLCSFIVFFALAMIIHSNCQNGYRTIVIGDDYFPSVEVASSAAAGQRSVISVPTGIVKANPFVPYRNIDNVSNVVEDVPLSTLIAPPEAIEEGSDAARIMDTVVSGILYDKYSPSAILNIEGNDYLVKKGDVVNNYKILNIMQDSVTVKLGSNTYKAGIGEILTEGSLNYNTVSNLGKKFGGEK